MRRATARLPESVTELCLVRLGIQTRGVRGLWYARRVRRAIEASSADAVASGSGLLRSEPFLMAWDHFGVLQYWRSFEAMEAWSHAPPHSVWWRDAVERMRSRGDLGVYHEAYLVPRDRVESVYLDCRPVGLAAFGPTVEPVGPDTNSRGRLGLGPGRLT